MNEALSTEVLLASEVDIRKHQRCVQRMMTRIALELLARAEQHDLSKLGPEEAPLFAESFAKLKTLTYGSPEYQEALKNLGPALAHHYARNDHHPEHFPGGINDMNICMVVEMFCDWVAASQRQNNGNLHVSLEKALERFGVGPMLGKVFRNSISLVEDIKHGE